MGPRPVHKSQTSMASVFSMFSMHRLARLAGVSRATVRSTGLSASHTRQHRQKLAQSVRASRALSTAGTAALTVRQARQLLGLPPAVSDARSIKAAYYEVAKRLHPDLNPSDDGANERFARAADACELLLAQLEMGHGRGADDADGTGWAGTGTREAARGTAASGGTSAGTRARYAPRMPTAAELICSRLELEPGATAAVWAELRAHGLRPDGVVMDGLFRACGAERRDEALGLFEQAAPLLSAEDRRSALVSLLSWCHEEAASDWTFRAVGLVGPDDLTPEVQAALSRTFSYFPSGASF